MRWFLILACIFSVTFSARAQIFSKNWAPGNYYDTLGRKTSGLIAWSRPDHIGRDTGDHIFYKINKSATKQKLSTLGISTFTIGTDSFVVSKSPSLYYAPVLKVLLNNKTKLYYWESSVVTWGQTIGASGGLVGAVIATAITSGSKRTYTSIPGFAGGSRAYFFGDNPNDLFLLTKKNFIDVMISMLADKPKIVKEIADKKMWIGDMDDILEYYRTGKKPVVPVVPDYY